ncbi:MAG: hypothetical protein V7637_5347 [Mycobacteriales bacterium]
MTPVRPAVGRARGPRRARPDAGPPARLDDPDGTCQGCAVSGDAQVRVQILGRVSAWRADAPVVLGPSGRRAVLGLLALAGGRPLSRGELIDSLWGDRPPPSAANVIQTHVARLRRLLEPGRPSHARSDLLPAVGDGYALQLPADSIDLLRFRRLVAEATDPARYADVCGAAALLDEALRLWPEPALVDLPALANHPKVVALAEERRAALARYAEAMIAAGSAADAIGLLEAAAAADPLDEPGLAQLLRAYHAAGRRARAVELYGQARRRLADELGMAPGPELAAAHAALLAEGPPEARPATVQSGRPAAPVPAQLPADVPGFVGRAAELAALTRLSASAGVPLVVAGTAGVGKTGLALRWAHQTRTRFPDGQLYVNLRGYDPAQPMPAADALAGFLRALGGPGTDVPADEAERAAAYRTLLDGRRVLVFLDNAGTVEQIRPLLPGTPSCQVLVTSRDSLAGLVAMHGARRLDLDQLPPPDAAALLRALIGDRVDAEPAAAAALADRCARLPLALRIAAELAAARPGTPLAALVGELADQQRRLDLLDAAGDPRAAVRAVFSWSYRYLPDGAARLFRLLGLHPSPDFDTAAATALAGPAAGAAETAGPEAGAAAAALVQLARAHLVRPAGPGRYGMHDLLRAYALELAEATDPEPDRRDARTRLFDHYLAAATAAMTTLHPADRDRAPRRPAAAPASDERDRARAWLDAERAALVAVIGYAAAYGWPEQASRLAGTLFRYFNASADLATGLAIHSQAVAAARRTSDRSDMARSMTDLGVVHARQGRLDQAAAHFQQALAMFQETGDRTGEARALLNLGNVGALTGRYREAADSLRQAIALYQQGGNPVGEARARNSLGGVYCRLGEYAPAAAQHRQALTLHRRAGDRDGEGYGRNGLGEAHAGQGGYELAAEQHRQALALFQQTGNRDGEACSLTNLADVSLRLGRPAVQQQRQALALFEETGNASGEARAHTGLGAALRAAGRPDQAREHLTAALALADRAGDRHQQARAHDELALLCQAAGDDVQAEAHRARVSALTADAGRPATQLRERA